MSTGSTALLAPLAAILAALIAASISFIALLVAKENKVSEFRQSWIDSLRTEISDYMAAVGLWINAEQRWMETGETTKESVWHDYIKTIQPSIERMESTSARVRLRLNKEDTDPRLRQLNNDLLRGFDSIRDLMSQRKYGEARAVTAGLQELAAPILKMEWERVKIGEPTYRVAKWAAALVVLVALASTVVSSGMLLNQLLT